MSIMNDEKMMVLHGWSESDRNTWIENNAKYYEDPLKAWHDKLMMHTYTPRSAAVYVMPGYQSPASGKWIETPRQRREDFKETGTRPWEGMKDEQSHVDSNNKADEVSKDKAIDHTVRTAWQHMPDSKKQAALAAI